MKKKTDSFWTERYRDLQSGAQVLGLALIICAVGGAVIAFPAIAAAMYEHDHINGPTMLALDAMWLFAIVMLAGNFRR